MKIQYCVITKNKYGETIQIFNTKEQAEEFIKATQGNEK